MMSQVFEQNELVKGNWRRVLLLALWGYGLAVMVMCFIPQPHLFGNIHTPNVMAIGRFRLLLIPLNSLWSLPQLTRPLALIWVIGQNIMNGFLLYPLVFLMHCLWKNWQSPRKSLWLGFWLSLAIELTQLFLDMLIDANRVFEVDDLWTNSLGALLAFYSYRWLSHRLWLK
ncbi:VanZ family protein [Streptococcus canis]|uniref:VanZ family protein n=1 Tax=Streptococcus canis TaxID=1329 RepID=UPI0013887D12|nr:VanZ family protein [Streptococcus canis]GFG42388.1 VanZ family protein [Streptococcus canis]